MRKKLVCVLIILIVVLFMAARVFANPGNDTTEVAGYIGENGENSTGEIETDESESEDEGISPFEAYLQEIIKKADMEETEQFLVTLTEPKKDNCPIVFEKMNICGFVINGKTKPEEAVIVILARYNDETGLYEELENTEGESRWQIGLFGLFAKEVRLPVGINKLKITIFKIPGEIASLLNLEGKKTAEDVDLDNEAGIEEGNGEEKAGTEKETVGNNALAETDSRAKDEEDGINAGVELGEAEAENIIELVAGEDLQINFFTIKVHDEATREKLINNKVDISDIFNNIVVPR